MTTHEKKIIVDEIEFVKRQLDNCERDFGNETNNYNIILNRLYALKLIANKLGIEN